MPLALQVNYFAFVAEEVRIGLASLGLRSLDELVGRADLLKQSVTKLPKTEGLDLSFLTTFAGKSGSSNERRGQEVGSVCWLCHTLLMPERCQLVLVRGGQPSHNSRSRHHQCRHSQPASCCGCCCLSEKPTPATRVTALSTDNSCACLKGCRPLPCIDWCVAKRLPRASRLLCVAALTSAAVWKLSRLTSSLMCPAAGAL